MTDLNESLRLIKHQLADAKKRRTAINDEVARLEKAIIDHPLVSFDAEGTTKIDDELKIASGYTRKWDQAMLGTLCPKIDPAYWPFKVEYKEDRKASRVFEERFPELATELNKALTLTPRKPTITVNLDD